MFTSGCFIGKFYFFINFELQLKFNPEYTFKLCRLKKNL